MRIDIMLPLAMAAVLMTATIGGSALAADRDGDREAAALQGAKVSLTQAIATAEGQTGGRAIGADVSQEGGVTRIQVEVAGPQGFKTVLVDGATGQVTATRDGGGDNEDND